MTWKEFLKALAATKDWGWEIDCDGGIRCPSEEVDMFCPITAVCHAKQREIFTTDEWEIAAITIKLPKDIALSVINGADFQSSKSIDYAYTRNQLLAALGLTEAED